jgi:hypothetical protein
LLQIGAMDFRLADLRHQSCYAVERENVAVGGADRQLGDVLIAPPQIWV